jgi:hypothetical protein
MGVTGSSLSDFRLYMNSTNAQAQQEQMNQMLNQQVFNEQSMIQPGYAIATGTIPYTTLTTSSATPSWTHAEIGYVSQPVIQLHMSRNFHRINEQDNVIREPLDELRLKVAEWLN